MSLTTLHEVIIEGKPLNQNISYEQALGVSGEDKKKLSFRRKKLLEGALSGSRASALTDWGERKNEREARA